MTRRAAAAALAAMSAVCAIGCYRERERLDIPELTLQLEATVVAPRDTIRGVVRASDGSGLSLLRILAVSARDAARERLDTTGRRYDLDGRRTVEIAFAFAVDSLVPAGTFVEMQALVVDNQDFPVELRDTVRVQAQR